jgi:predicted amidohydrolase
MGAPTRDPLPIAAVQPLCVDDVAGNVRIHAESVRAAAARVVVFPEMSLTGYELDAPVITVDDPRLAPLIAACADAGSLALVGAPVASPAGDHIAVLAVDATGATVAYRKMWLGDAEAERFTAGDEPAAVEVDGWRLGLAICKDTGVAQHAADTAGLGIDAYVAGVLDSADDAAVQEERARRIAADHHVWVVVASFAGSTGGGYEHAAARSRIWSPDGVVVARAGRETGGIARCDLTDPSRPPPGGAPSRGR